METVEEEDFNGEFVVGDVADTKSKQTCQLVCPVMYAQYYSGTEIRVLVSTLHTTPVWLKVVRESKNEQLCDSIVWTDFKMTTDSVFSSAWSGSDVDCEEDERNQSKTVTHLPHEVKRSLRRYFYETFCKELATKYGIPTLLTFYNNLERGLTLGEDDYNHQVFVDSMLSDFRFVAAIKIPSPTDDQQQSESITSETVNDTNTERNTTLDERSKTTKKKSEFLHDDDDYEFDDEGVLDLYGEIYEKALNKPIPAVPKDLSEQEMESIFKEYESELKNMSQEESSVNLSIGREENPSGETIPLQTQTDEPMDTSQPIIFEEDLQAEAATVIQDLASNTESIASDNVPLDAAIVIKEQMTENIASNNVPAVPAEIRDRVMTESVPSQNLPLQSQQTNKQKLEPLNEDTVLFKRPADPELKRRFRELGSRPSKENTDTSESEDDRWYISDSSSESEAAFGIRTGATRRRRAGDHFEIVDCRLTHEDANTLGTQGMEPDTVLFIYRLERKSNTTLRLVRVYEYAAKSSVPPINLSTISWPAKDMIERLRSFLGNRIVLSKRQVGSNPSTIQIRHVNVDDIFRNTIPNVLVLLKRSTHNLPLRV